MGTSHLFHLSHLKPHNDTSGGIRIKATAQNFPILKGMSLYWLKIYPKGIREPHWHSNADELGFCLKGQVLVSIYGNENIRQKFLINPGEVFYIPSGYLHAIENVSEENAELIVQFSHEEPEDFGISAALGMFSDAVLGNTWGMSGDVFKHLKRSTKEVFATVSKNPIKVPKEWDFASPFKFDLESSAPLISNEAGVVKVARQNVWPILKRQALYSLLLTNQGMREPHWHPETQELGYVRKGHGRMSILSPDGSVDTYEMKTGDLYFIPAGYPHHIENLGNESLQLMIYFDKSMPEDIGFTGSVMSFTPPVLNSVMNTSVFDKLPQYPEDLFLVNRVNPLDLIK